MISPPARLNEFEIKLVRTRVDVIASQFDQALRLHGIVARGSTLDLLKEIIVPVLYEQQRLDSENIRLRVRVTDYEKRCQIQ